jgi:glycosyltransferase involved in cell wall biosynthesis
MTPEERKQIVLEVHGANLEQQTLEFQEKIEKLRAPMIEEGVVQWVGPYQPHELRDRMKNLDWVVIPSIWWENSPMVIQEAFSLRRPLVGSDIGGMAEKIKNHVNGLHVATGNSHDWKKKLLEAKSTTQWEKCHKGIKSPISYKKCADVHLQGFL